MKRLLSIMFVLMACSTAFSQSAQNGIVKEYNDAKKKNPLAGVEIVVNNAGSNVSAKNGKFVLSFRTLKPGDKVEVRKIEKAGYEIFNKDALDAWRIANDGSEFTIVLCKSAKFKALKDQYNAVASKSYAQQQKKDEQRLASLLKEGKLQQAEYEKKLKELKDKYDEQLENLDNYIDRFARIDLETISKEEQKIIEMVKEGKIEEAIAAYEAMNLEEKYAQAATNVHIANDAISKLQSVVKKAESEKNDIYKQVKNKNNLLIMLGGRENFERVKSNLITCAENDTTAINVVWDCAEFLSQQEDLALSEKYYLICYRQCMKTNKYDKVTLTQLSDLCYDIACLYMRYRQFDKAEKYVLRTLEFADSLEQKSESILTLNVDCLDILLQIKVMGNRFEEAEKYADAIWDKAKELVDYDDEKYRSYYLQKTNNIIILYYNSGKLPKAMQVLNTSIPLADVVALNNNADDKYIAASLRILKSDCLLYSGDTSAESATLLNDAIKLFSELYEYNPDKYHRQYAECLNKMGKLYYFKNNLVNSEIWFSKSYIEAVKVYDKLGESYAYEFIDIVNNLACSQLMQGKYSECMNNFQKVLPLSRNLCEKNENSGMYRNNYIRLLANMGLTECKSNHLDSANEYIDQSCKMVMSESIKSLDDRVLLSTVLSFKGVVYLYEGKKDEAVELYKKIKSEDPNFFVLYETNDLYVKLKEEKLIQ